MFWLFLVDRHSLHVSKGMCTALSMKWVCGVATVCCTTCDCGTGPILLSRDIGFLVWRILQEECLGFPRKPRGT